MANTIRVKRSSVDGRIPSVTDLELGEIAINTYMGKMFIKQKRGLVESIVQIGSENVFTYSAVEPSSPQNGDMWMIPATGTLYVYVDGIGWEVATGEQGPTGTGGAKGYYLSVYDTTNQYSAGALIENILNLGTVMDSNGISVINGNTIRFDHAGTYNVQYSIQYTNIGDDPDIVNIWGVLNGAVMPDSNSKFQIPMKTTEDHGHLIAVSNYVFTVGVGETFQIRWSTTCEEPNAIWVDTIPEEPPVAATPGVILSVTPVMYLETPPFTVGPTPPSSPSIYDLWIDTN